MTIIKDFSQKKFEVQVKYATGWETIASLSPLFVDQDWHRYRRRYAHLKTRLLVDGRPERGDK